MKRVDAQEAVMTISGECLLMRTRLLARALTAIYDEHLAGYGIAASQLNLLVAIARFGPIRRSELARFMHIDVSTLTRNLRVMQKNGWIATTRSGADGRGMPVSATAAGVTLIGRVAPAWERAQQQAADLLDDHGDGDVTRVADRLMSGAA